MTLSKEKIPWGLCLPALAWLALMIAAVSVDYDWTLTLREHRVRAFDRFMERSLFEGEGFGGGDPVVFVILLAAGAYGLAWKKGALSRFHAWRPCLGFILTSALTVSVMMVHSLKWVMGRARPALVVKEKMPFTDWFVFGPHFITEGSYRGSFPSGHTAQAFVLFGIAYVLAAAGRENRVLRAAGWAWGAFCMVYVVLMGVSRCMSLSHWLTDVLGAFGLSWMLMHAIYAYMLKVPEQMGHYRKNGIHPEAPVAWELRLCFHILGMTAGGVSLLLGLRAVLLGAPWKLYLLMPAGIPLMVFFYSRFQALRRRSLEAVVAGEKPWN